MITRFSIVLLIVGVLTGCAYPSANNGSVFKANEMNADVFSSSVQGR